MQRAVDLIEGWCSSRPIPGLTVEVHQLPGRTPLIVVEVHPPVGLGRRHGVAVRTPRQTTRDGRVARGPRTVDAGARGRPALRTRCRRRWLCRVRQPHGHRGRPRGRRGDHALHRPDRGERGVGVADLPAYVEALATRIGRPSLVVCLDSGCIDYDRMWVTTSLRGLAGGVLSVDIVTEGLHSGDVSGMIPSSFRISRSLLSRIEDEVTGQVLLPELTVEIPADRSRGAGDRGRDRSDGRPLPVRRRCRPHHRRCGRTAPFADVATGPQRRRRRRPPAHGPGGQRAGPGTTLKLSMRPPPTCDPAGAVEAMRTALVTDPPMGHGSRSRARSRGRAGTRPFAPGWSTPSTWPRWRRSGSPHARSARVGRSRSWGCSVRSFQTPSS